MVPKTEAEVVDANVRSSCWELCNAAHPVIWHRTFTPDPFLTTKFEMLNCGFLVCQLHKKKAVAETNPWTALATIADDFASHLCRNRLPRSALGVLALGG